MNRNRRRQINGVIEMLRVAHENIDTIKTDEEFAFDSLPEGLQSSMRGEQMEEAVELLDEAMEHIDEVIELLEEVSQ